MTSATRFPTAFVFVDAASVRDASTLFAETARAVGASGTDAPLDVLAAWLGRRRLLLVLDNLEQIPTPAQAWRRCSDGRARPTCWRPPGSRSTSPAR